MRRTRIVQEPAGSAAQTLERIERMGGYRRALEFQAIGFRNRLRREWRLIVHRLEGPELAAAAELATRQGWHFEAIRAAAKAEAFDRLDLRFPIAWRREAEAAARSQGIDPAWVLATNPDGERLPAKRPVIGRSARAHAGHAGDRAPDREGGGSPGHRPANAAGSGERTSVSAPPTSASSCAG